MENKDKRFKLIWIDREPILVDIEAEIKSYDRFATKLGGKYYVDVCDGYINPKIICSKNTTNHPEKDEAFLVIAGLPGLPQLDKASIVEMYEMERFANMAEHYIDTYVGPMTELGNINLREILIQVYKSNPAKFTEEQMSNLFTWCCYHKKTNTFSEFQEYLQSIQPQYEERFCEVEMEPTFKNDAESSGNTTCITVSKGGFPKVTEGKIQIKRLI